MDDVECNAAWFFSTYDMYIEALYFHLIIIITHNTQHTTILFKSYRNVLNKQTWIFYLLIKLINLFLATPGLHHQGLYGAIFGILKGFVWGFFIMYDLKKTKEKGYV